MNHSEKRQQWRKRGRPVHQEGDPPKKKRQGAASAFPLGRGDLREVLLLAGRQLGEESIGRGIVKGRRLGPGYGPGVGQPQAEVLENPANDERVLRYLPPDKSCCRFDVTRTPLFELRVHS